MALQQSDSWYLPEEYLLEEEELGRTILQSKLIYYLVDVLEWLFRVEKWHIGGNLELHHPAVRNSLTRITPDISVFKGIKISPQEIQSLLYWDIRQKRVTPPVVFEISSHATWRSDILADAECKPAIYGRIGVKEYFAYDPHEPLVWEGTNGRRLLGWRYEHGNPVELQLDEQDRLWSNELNSWLKADGFYLRLYDRENNLRLTKAEAKDLDSQKKDRALQEKDNTIQEKDNTIQEKDKRIAELERLLRELKGGNSQG